MGINESVVRKLVPPRRQSPPLLEALPNSSSNSEINKVSDLSEGPVTENELKIETSEEDKPAKQENIHGIEEVKIEIPIIENKINQNDCLREHLSTLDGSDYIMLFGFGKNPIGRFSLIGAYQKSTGIRLGFF